MKSQHPNQPDRARAEDFDDVDIPTVSGNDIYARVGRAAPQTISPQQQPPVEDTTPVAASDTVELDSAAPTTTFESVTPASPTRKEPALASDAPTTAFDAPAGPTPGQQRAADVAKLLPPLDEDPARPSAGTKPVDEAPTAVVASPATPKNQTSFDPAPPTDVFEPVAQPLIDPVDTESAEYAALNDDAVVQMAADPRRGTMDFGLLLLRLVLGAILGFHALAVFFSLAGNAGMVGLQNEYAQYTYPSMLAIAIPALELTAAVFLILGLMAPIASAVAIAATGFTLIHQIWAGGTEDGIILAGVLLGIAMVLQFTGPGRYGLDFSRGWARRPLASSYVLGLLGVAGAVALWWFGTGINPLA
ncbi:DoxX family protein [Corynebacterium aquilae]|uniref:DoxX family protein n=1 Tax=Corynebacterium aquilae DSM 44791 TaxID=1431546 RepID=A0A1L7CFK5_9CORY|nr:DoxX family protein [Corynebacterium aquilae]APT84604.1 hypothetical protein CAQU_05455 [Corynebacterium aquilae DSM 44791]